MGAADRRPNGLKRRGLTLGIERTVAPDSKCRVTQGPRAGGRMVPSGQAVSHRLFTLGFPLLEEIYTLSPTPACDELNLTPLPWW